MEFLFSFFQIIKNFEYILRILSRELILVFNESLSCLNKIMIIFNLIESDDFLFDSIDFVQLLLFLLNSFCFFSFSLNNNSFWFGYLFWGLIVSSFEFFIGGFKFFKELIDTLLVLGWKLILFINELLAKLHVFSLVMMSFLNAVHLVRLWKKHA